MIPMRLIPTLLLLAVAPAAAQNLQQVLRSALQNDPAVLEAQADVAAAESDMDAARAGHHPIITLTGSQTLLQKQRYNNRKARFNPGVQATLNLYSWGAVESRIDQSRHRLGYYRHKANEVSDTVGQEIGTLYLSALRAKELISAAQHSLKRHHAVIKDLQIITRHDKGRLSELVQARARALQVESYLAEQTRLLELSLSRLGKYTGNRIAPQHLRDPFARDTPDSLIQRYRNRDLASLPSYRAQAAERESVLAEGNTRKASRYPGINLIANASRDNREIYISLSWDAYNPAAAAEVEKSAHTLAAAEAKMDAVLRDSAERSRSAEVDMRQSLKRAAIAQQQIAVQKQVVKAYELQFKIARRTLIDVLDAYSDLSSIELAEVSAQNDFRDAAWNYLAAQGALVKWAGVSSTLSAAPETSVASEQQAYGLNHLITAPDAPDAQRFRDRAWLYPTAQRARSLGKSAQTSVQTAKKTHRFREQAWLHPAAQRVWHTEQTTPHRYRDRSPTVRSHAPILSVGAEAVFTPAAVQAKTF